MVVEVNWPKLKATTWAYLGVLAGGSLAMQFDWVNRHVTPVLDKHPKLAPLSGGLLGALTLLHNPEVQGLLRTFSGSFRVVTPAGNVATGKVTGTELETGGAAKTVGNGKPPAALDG